MPHRFSPIKNKDSLLQAIIYTATNSSALCEAVIGKQLPIHSLTIFSHFEDEFVFLKKLLSTIGTPYNENNGPRIALHKPIIIDSHTLTHLRIRKPDSERPQVGCNDFDVKNYKDFNERYLEIHPDHLTLIKRPEYEMIEFHHPDFDVLAYVVSS